MAYVTRRQRKAVDNLVGNGGNITKTMRQVGYDEATVNTPGKLTKSKGWIELMKQYLPDDKLLAKHNEALEAIKINEFSGERLPDHNVRLKAVELGYKLKGKLNDTSGNIIGDKQIIILNYAKPKPETVTETVSETIPQPNSNGIAQ